MFEGDEGGGGVGGTCSHAALDGEAFLDVDVDFGDEAHAGGGLLQPCAKRCCGGRRGRGRGLR